ncbi:envelope stress response membrane protein PspC [Zobellella denitrificans]|mgnify:CR=1 FL=1|jgi:phage shock protein C|uniref:Phage-shock protein n=1 Tax=Zobellella denitrificans TaxID=347534 RepID=A0A231MYH4_9GAMM|nr:envelope stress response membrane protein PspC [Zobellella denitrificans]ATG73608.1 phage-shock protein [Zobellella denitrificans]OXS15283.1 envelope stress response membrane protein PspC [Zobellella denitrificans]
MASTLMNLYRDKRNGKLGGVCAGIARKAGVEPWLVRVLAVTGLVFASFLTFVLYMAAWLLLEDRPDQPEPEPAHVKSAGWQSGLSPKEALDKLEGKLRRLNGRVAEMEQLLTSREFRLRREFNDLREDK